MNKLLFLLSGLIVGFFSCAYCENLPYNYQDTNFVPIKMSVLKEYSSKEDIFEGQEVELRVLRDAYFRNCLIVKKGTIVKAKIETVITKGMNGFPAEIVLDDFKIPNVKDSQLMSTYIKTGKNYALLVYPLKWALTPIPFVGSLTNLIMGGEAKIKKDDIIVVKFYPYWK